MLYKNEEPYRLMEPEIEKLVKYFHNKFPLKVVYPPNRIVKSKLPHNKLPDKPNSISFDLKAIVKTDKGTEVWRYAENVIGDPMGKKRYLPKKFRFNGARFLTRQDIELIYFLFKKSEHCLGGENQGRMPKFMFEDLVTEAEKKAAKKELESRVDMLLYNKEFGLPEERLREVAKAYFIKGVDNLSFAQVKILLSSKIHETKEGPDNFFEMVNLDQVVKARSDIQKAMDMEILKFDESKRAWAWQVKGEQGVTQICRVPPNKSPSESLYDHYNGNQRFKDDLQSVLISKKPKLDKKSKVTEPDDADEKEE